ncbi:MAG: cyclic nucleotide-binding domain-containing protein [Gammaproteobacteria bacterium]|nr:cyclic nucleotide-binding domain-containing protein [Gammaproteobacteria bacterium]
MAIDKKTALSRIAPFSALPRPLISKLADLSGIQHIGKGSTLFRQGERAHFVYALVEGNVSLISGPEREETIADFMAAGDIILVPPALLRLPYMVTARAVTDLLVLMIPAEDFRQLAEAELSLSVSLNRMLASHWRLLLRHLTQTKSRDADTRLIQYLIDSAGTSAGPAKFTLPGSKRDLAAHLGVTPETLSRSLKRLGRLGVKTTGSEIEIEDLARLAALFQHSSHAAPADPTSSASIKR